MMPRHLRPPTGRHAAALGSLVVLIIAAGAVLAACGSGGSSSAATNSATGRSVQRLATVTRGDLVQSVTGRAQLGSVKSSVNVKVAVQVTASGASQVAVGQSATVSFIKLPAGAGRFFGSASPRPGVAQSGAPSAAQSGAPGAAPSGAPGASQGGQGFFGGGQGALRGKTAQGTVTAVSAGSNGAVTATVTIAKLPAGVTAKYTGFAQIKVKVLASNVLLVPTAAIKGSGSSATVQLLAGGKTSTQDVVVGRQSAGESEITSGLSAGQNVVYTQKFTGRFPGAGGNRPSGGFPQSGGQAPSVGFPQSGGQAGGAPSGT
jgi:membrane fusion protein, macrolide-specific efflux system